jgi:ATP-binding cassette subfamily C protein CydCD
MVSPVRAMWREMHPQRRELALAGLLGSIAAISAVALLGTSGYLISRAAEMPPVLTLSVAAVLVRTFALSRSIARYLERLVGHDAAFRGLTSLRVTVYASLRRLTPASLAAFGRGDLLQRLVADVDTALDLPLRVVLPWVQAVVVGAASVAFLAWLLPPTAALIGVLVLVALVLVPWFTARVGARAAERSAPAKAGLTASVVEALDATPDLAAFGAVSSTIHAVRARDDRVTALAGRESFALGLGAGASTVVQGAAVAGSLLIAVPAVVDEALAPVWLAVAALLPLALFDVLATLPAAATAYQKVRSSAVRLEEVTGAPAAAADPSATPAATLPDGFPGLSLHGVHARWPGRAVDTLTDVDLAWAPGERIAVVGPSGSGKSTLAAVLLGFLPYEGSFAVGGVEARDVDGDDLRARVGVLSQRAHVFGTSIADNVRLGDPTADDARVMAALDAARLGEWVRSLPDGASTLVGSFGTTISGGEGQRLALARLLLAERPAVILDEPTEHLDAATAAGLAHTLADALAGRGVLLITHRIADLVIGVDRILVIQEGRITQAGTHEALVGEPGWYAEQWSQEAQGADLAALLERLPVGRAVPGPVR